MLPSLTATPEPGVQKPPSWFKPADSVKCSWYSSGGLAGRVEGGGSVAQLSGLRYEKKVQERLKGVWSNIKLGPWITFSERSGLRKCQPDVLLEELVHTTIFEIKNVPSSDGWWQLKHLYAPVVSKMLGVPSICVLIVREFDPAVVWPEPIKFFSNFDSWRLSRISPDYEKVSVIEWKL